MQKVTISGMHRSPFRVLCLGAHCDDIEIGCGGSLLKMLGDSISVHVCWVVFCSNPTRMIEAQHSAEEFLGGAHQKRIIIKEFRDGFLPYSGAEIKDFFETLKTEFLPDLIFTHYRDDRHQDHRLISDLTWNTYRDHLILEYEIPKYDGDLGTPNFYVKLDQQVFRQKMQILLEYYVSQKNKFWFTEETFLSLARLRGVESGADHAEAFYCRKILLE